CWPGVSREREKDSNLAYNAFTINVSTQVKAVSTPTFTLFNELKKFNQRQATKYIQSSSDSYECRHG
ncbi:MAG: hypothetical protein ABIO76_06520, partial [Ginsengibacter sp.]